MKTGTALVCLLVLGLSACRRNQPRLPEFGKINDFELVDQTGQKFAGRSLAGRVWVADFIYTTCPGPCPRMTSQMHQVQEGTRDLPEVRLVSFSVDPATDTPTALAAYAKVHGASPARWTFLTGPQATLHQLCRYEFKLGDVDGSLMHSTRFVLVDRKSEIRGYYETSEAEAIPKLLADIRAVAGEGD